MEESSNYKCFGWRPHPKSNYKLSPVEDPVIDFEPDPEDAAETGEAASMDGVEAIVVDVDKEDKAGYKFYGFFSHSYGKEIMVPIEQPITLDCKMLLRSADRELKGVYEKLAAVEKAAKTEVQAVVVDLDEDAEDYKFYGFYRHSSKFVPIEEDPQNDADDPAATAAKTNVQAVVVDLDEDAKDYKFYGFYPHSTEFFPIENPPNVDKNPEATALQEVDEEFQRALNFKASKNAADQSLDVKTELNPMDNQVPTQEPAAAEKPKNKKKTTKRRKR